MLFSNRRAAHSAGGSKRNPPPPAFLPQCFGPRRIFSSAPILRGSGNALTSAVYGYFSTIARTDRGAGARCKRAAIAPKPIATTCVKRASDSIEAGRGPDASSVDSRRYRSRTIKLYSVRRYRAALFLNHFKPPNFLLTEHSWVRSPNSCYLWYEYLYEKYESYCRRARPGDHPQGAQGPAGREARHDA